MTTNDSEFSYDEGLTESIANTPSMTEEELAELISKGPQMTDEESNIFLERIDRKGYPQKDADSMMFSRGDLYGLAVYLSNDFSYPRVSGIDHSSYDFILKVMLEKFKDYDEGVVFEGEEFRRSTFFTLSSFCGLASNSRDVSPDDREFCIMLSLAVDFYFSPKNCPFLMRYSPNKESFLEYWNSYYSSLGPRGLYNDYRLLATVEVA